MTDPISLEVTSEVGELEGVILHTPGPEVENMTPASAERALYSDVLNLAVISPEYTRFEQTLGRMTRVFEVKELLCDILIQDHVKTDLVSAICVRENVRDILPGLMSVAPEELSRLLIEGVVMEKDNLTKYLDRERYALQPLHNFFFMRDAAAVIFDKVLISQMANQVRERESMIMAAIFEHHPMFDARISRTFEDQDTDSKAAPKATPKDTPKATIEGGDIIVAREDIVIVGQGARTSTQGIDALIEHLKKNKDQSHIIVQELPYKPESFIHLDMVFTLLDVDACMVYKPLVLDSNRYLTLHIRIDHGKVTIREASSIPSVLEKLGMPLKTICCGGDKDTVIQEREQWHSGANFFCVGPGKIMGYGRNVFTLEELARNGFEIITAAQIEDGGFDLQSRQKVAVTIEGTELARGGGGCRCMTMPLKRKKVDFNV